MLAAAADTANPLIYIGATVIGALLVAQVTWFGRSVVEMGRQMAAMKPQVDQIPQIQEDVRVVSAQVAHIEGQLVGRPK